MIRLSDEVLPENRTVVNGYIGNVWPEVITFVRSLKWAKGTEELAAKFQSHTTAEEVRLQKNLEDIKYGIDSHEVVRLVSGHGRTETVRWPTLHTSNRLTPGKTLLPMLYLVLKRHLQKISLARKHVLAESEFPDAAETIEYIAEAAMYRVSDLRGEK